MYHQNSEFGKLQSLLDSNKCVCGEDKTYGKSFGYECFKDLKDKNPKLSRNLTFAKGEERLELFLEALEELNLKKVAGI